MAYATNSRQDALVERAHPGVVGEIIEAAPAARSHRVDQGVDLAKFRFDLPEGIGHLRLVGRVDSEGQYVRHALCLNGRPCLLQRLGVATKNADVPALGGKALGDGEPDTRRSASDNADRPWSFFLFHQ